MVEVAPQVNVDLVPDVVRHDGFLVPDNARHHAQDHIVGNAIFPPDVALVVLHYILLVPYALTNDPQNIFYSKSMILAATSTK